MFRNRIFLKSLAVFLILETLGNVVWPTISYALTAGPTAPEATSFEPVDTTDMVNLASGDLAYNIPLLEVPGPSGGYPLSLSYHAGIMPGEEASWVGLGWTLNPGAITRSVNGFADDQFNVNNSSRFFWEGGETHSVVLGVTAGISGVAGPSATVEFSKDTYQGFGMGGSIGYTLGVFKAEFGISPYGGASASVGVSVGVGKTEGEGPELGLKLSTDFESVDADVEFESEGFKASAGVSSEGAASFGANVGSLGVSMSTSKEGGSVGISVGNASISNSKSGKISSVSMGLILPLPLITIGYNYQRYWIDETANVYVNGSLYNPTSSVSSGFDSKAYDSYTLLDVMAGIAENPDPEKVMGGSFINYDNYDVSGQGIGGSMRPYSFKNLIFRQNRKNGSSYKIKQFPYASGYSTQPFEFRFEGDFSNRYTNNGGSITAGVYPLMPSFGASEQTGEAGTTSDGIVNGHLAGSRHIEWYTNSQILGTDNSKNPTSEGFINCDATGFTRLNTGSKGNQIGGFKITNESGVTYHFALPAYAYDEYQYSENIKQGGGTKFNEIKKPEAYAYTWYLTSVTGPDFVDRGPTGTADGILNEYDWGYWVKFEYGKWTDGYVWRNPSNSMDYDLDQDFKNFAEGKKEIYYLDAVKTKTHTALFFKDIRHDQKGALKFFRNISQAATRIDSGPVIEGQEKINITAATKSGGYTPKQQTCDCEKYYHVIDTSPLNPFPSRMYLDDGDLTYIARPTSTLKLDTIVLVNNEDLKLIPLSKADGEEYAMQYTYSWDVDKNEYPSGFGPQCDFSSTTFNPHQYQNVLDIYDLRNVKSQLQNKAVRVIKFGQDYSLAPETINSFDNELVKVANPSFIDDNYPKFGKLTLKSLQILGKQGVDLLPPMTFDYELANPKQGTATLLTGSDSKTFKFSNVNSSLEEGDIMKFTSNNKTIYAVVYNILGNEYTIKIVGKDLPTSGYITWVQTKNPPFNSLLRDIWGMYKSDYLGTATVDKLRSVTERSSKNLDAWSLRTVGTNLGAEIKIGYEADSYKRPSLLKSSMLRVQSVAKIPASSNYKLTIYDDMDLNEVVQVGDTVQYSFLFANTYENWHYNSNFNPSYMKTESNFDPKVYENNLIVTAVYESSGLWVIETSSGFGSYFQTAPMEHTVQMGQFPPIYDDKKYQTPVFIAGNLSLGNDYKNWGSGIRVTSVSIESFDKATKTAYDYSQYGTSNTSGVTAYDPDGLEKVEFHFPTSEYFGSASRISSAEKKYNKALYTNFSKLLAIARDIPPPGVLYGNVRVSELVTKNEMTEVLPNSSLYEFQVFSDDFVGIDSISYSVNENNGTYNSIDYKRTKFRDIAIKNASAHIGQLKSITLLDKNGNALNKTINHFLFDEVTGEGFDEKMTDYGSRLANQFKSQGAIHETTIDGRFVKNSSGDFELLGVLSRKQDYPAIQTGQTTVNYKSGITTTSNNMAFDFYSGNVVKTKSTDGYGNAFITETIPAYKKYSAMGLAAGGGKNMLVQETASYTYKADAADNFKPIGLVSASVQTWSNQVLVLDQTVQPTIWRTHASYAYIGDDNVALRNDGLHALTNNQLPQFTAWNKGDATTALWQRNGEVTLYDVQSHMLEASDINNQFVSTKMSSDQTQILATTTNARYNEFAYSGAEDIVIGGYFGGKVVQSGTISSDKTHTGSKSLKVITSGGAGFRYTALISSNRQMAASVWSDRNDAKLKYKVNGGATVVAALKPIRKAGNWYLLSAQLPTVSTNSSIEIWCESVTSNTYFDDFKVQPVEGTMIGYVYNQWGELSHILDNNNLYTEFRYDGLGRLTETYKETFVNDNNPSSTYGSNGIAKVSEVNYNYGIKKPFTVSINTSKTGTVGNITPTTTIAYNGESSILISNSTCSYLRLKSVSVDGKIISLNESTSTLADGSTMKVTYGYQSYTLLFSKAKADHSVVANFEGLSETVYCHETLNWAGNGYCYDGKYQWYKLDGCGAVSQSGVAATIQDLPTATLRTMAANLTCTNTCAPE